MTTFMNYLVEANLSLLIVLGMYKLLFHSETNFSFQRYFLLAGILLSITVPFIHFSANQAIQIPSLSEALPSILLPQVGNSNNSEFSSLLTTLLWWIYISGAVVFTIVFLFRIFNMTSVIHSAAVTTQGNFKIIDSDSNHGTFSFFNFIFIRSCDYSSPDERSQIIEHEKVHATSFHSLDILLLNFLSIIFWFNPFMLIYKKVFIQLHEFEADARSVESHDMNTYCNLLARVALQSFGFSLANHFNNSLTVKRILMIRSIKKKVHNWKLFLSITLFPCMFLLLACQEQIIAQQQPKEKPAVSDNDPVYMVVEEPPTYPGGFDKLSELIGDNMRYPKEARQKNIEGTVVVGFIVEKDGAVSSVEVLKGLEKDCDAEAMRVIKLSEAWNPGKQSGKVVRVKFVIPIQFKLQ